MRNTIWEKRIPTILGILLLLIGVGATSFLVQMGTNFIGKAAPSETPENVRITNISENSFSVSYTTSIKVLGSLSYGTDKNLGTSMIDDRNQTTGNLEVYKLHYITVKNLKPATKYYFAIISGKTTFLNGEEPFNITTGPALETEPSQQEPAAGKVTKLDGAPPDETAVYLTSEKGQAISTLIKSDGSYILPLNSMRTEDLTSYFNFTQDSILQMLVVGSSEQSNVMLKINQTNPIPTVILSKNYDFTLNNNSPTASISANLNFPAFSASPSAASSVQILTPKKDEEFTDQKPLFKGTAPADSNIKITIHSDEIQAQVKSDIKGNWSFRPQSALTPGLHTITVSTTDNNGIIKTIMQSFTVYAQGSQVNQSATPSATPTIIISTPTPTSLPTPTVIPTLIQSPTPTLFPTATPTFIPTPTPTIIVQKPVSEPGSSSLLISAITVFSTTVLGIISFVINRGNSSSL